MNFRDRLQQPRTMMPIGMMLLVIGILWPMFFHPTTNFAQNLSHGVRGMLFGLSIIINLVAWKAARQRRCTGT